MIHLSAIIENISQRYTQHTPAIVKTSVSFFIDRLATPLFSYPTSFLTGRVARPTLVNFGLSLLFYAALCAAGAKGYQMVVHQRKLAPEKTEDDPFHRTLDASNNAKKAASTALSIAVALKQRHANDDGFAELCNKGLMAAQSAQEMADEAVYAAHALKQLCGDNKYNVARETANNFATFARQSAAYVRTLIVLKKAEAALAQINEDIDSLNNDALDLPAKMKIVRQVQNRGPLKEDDRGQAGLLNSSGFNLDKTAQETLDVVDALRARNKVLKELVGAVEQQNLQKK